MLFLNIIILLSAICIIALLLLSVKKLGWKAPFNFSNISLIYALFYVAIPSYFAEDINTLYGWGFSFSSMLSLKVNSIFFTSAMLLYSYFRRPYTCDVHNYSRPGKAFTFILACTFIYLANLLYSEFYNLISISSETGYTGDTKFSDIYKLKTLAYTSILFICLSSSTLQLIISISCGLLLIAFDVIQGGRTTAFIVLVTIYINVVFRRKRLYLLPISFALCGLYIVGSLFRQSYIVDDGFLSSIISNLGEFRETSAGYLFYLTKHNINFGIFNALTGSFFSLLGPFRNYFDVELLGDLVSNSFGLGYGLGLHIFLESEIIFGAFGILAAPIMVVLFIEFSRIVCKFAINNSLIFYCLFVLMLRLVYREGFFVPFGLHLYLTVLFLIVLFISFRVKKLK